VVSKCIQDLDDMVTATKLARRFGRQAFGENPASYHKAAFIMSRARGSSEALFPYRPRRARSVSFPDQVTN